MMGMSNRQQWVLFITLKRERILFLLSPRMASMIINPNEEGKFDNFARFVEKRAYSHNKYRLVFEDKSVVNCIFDTCSESDNCLDIDDPAYEEYWMIVFKNLAT